MVRVSYSEKIFYNEKYFIDLYQGLRRAEQRMVRVRHADRRMSDERMDGRIDRQTSNKQTDGQADGPDVQSYGHTYRQRQTERQDRHDWTFMIQIYV
jgi:hypothetical protein